MNEEISPVIENGKIVRYICQLPLSADGYINIKCLENCSFNLDRGWTHNDKPLTLLFEKAETISVHETEKQEMNEEIKSIRIEYLTDDQHRIIPEFDDWLIEQFEKLGYKLRALSWDDKPCWRLVLFNRKENELEQE